MLRLADLFNVMTRKYCTREMWNDMMGYTRRDLCVMSWGAGQRLQAMWHLEEQGYHVERVESGLMPVSKMSDDEIALLLDRTQKYDYINMSDLRKFIKKYGHQCGECKRRELLEAPLVILPNPFLRVDGFTRALWGIADHVAQTIFWANREHWVICGRSSEPEYFCPRCAVKGAILRYIERLPVKRMALLQQRKQEGEKKRQQLKEIKICKKLHKNLKKMLKETPQVWPSLLKESIQVKTSQI